jgi:hypothetical protein
MDGPGFHVDVSKLTEASKGIADSIGDQDHFALKRLPGQAAQYGNIDLHGALADYCDRWSDGLDAGDGLRSYVRYYNSHGQPIGLDGKPGPNSATHIPVNADGSYPTPQGW